MQSSDSRPDSVVIFGAGGHAKSVSDAALAQGLIVRAYIDVSPNLTSFLGRPVYPEFIREFADQGFIVFVAIGDNDVRARVQSSHKIAWPSVRIATIIHPTASIAGTATLSEGVAVLQGGVVGSYTQVGAGVIINSGGVVDHDCQISDFASIGPGATIGGSVDIGRQTQVGMGAVVRNNTSIGENTIIGAASYVHASVPSDVVAYGMPAQVIRARET